MTLPKIEQFLGNIHLNWIPVDYSVKLETYLMKDNDKLNMYIYNKLKNLKKGWHLGFASCYILKCKSDLHDYGRNKV